METQVEAKVYPNKTYEGPIPRVLATQEFIERNRLTLNRSQDEIFEKMKGGADDMFGFTVSILAPYAEYERSKEFYNDEYKAKVASGEIKHEVSTDLVETVQDMVDYLIFGLGKALDGRGLSASRTVSKVGAWLWLLGREDLERTIHRDDLYNPYGMRALIAVCEDLGIEVSQECRDFGATPADY